MYSKCILLALIHAVRRWRRCSTAPEIMAFRTSTTRKTVTITHKHIIFYRRCRFSNYTWYLSQPLISERGPL